MLSLCGIREDSYLERCFLENLYAVFTGSDEGNFLLEPAVHTEVLDQQTLID